MKPRLGMPRALTAAVAAGLLAVPLGLAFAGGGTVDRPRLTDGAECNDIYSRQSGLSYTAPSGRLIAGFWAVTGDSGGAMVGTWADNPLTQVHNSRRKHLT